MLSPVVIIRHIKERHNKCSLQPLRWREGFTFLKAKDELSFDATGFILLALDAPVLQPDDAGLTDNEAKELRVRHPELHIGTKRPILLPDATWSLLPQVMRCVTGEPLLRSLPAGVQTAYPRVSKMADDPQGGLASVEALYLALKLMGQDEPSLLQGYYWKDAFLDLLQNSGN